MGQDLQIWDCPGRSGTYEHGITVTLHCNLHTAWLAIVYSLEINFSMSFAVAMYCSGPLRF